MKNVFIARQREPHQNEEKKKEPFFSKANKKTGAAFFKASGSGDAGMVQRVSLATPIEDEKLRTAEARMEKDKVIQEKPKATPAPDAADKKEPEKVQLQPATKPGTEEKEKIQTKGGDSVSSNSKTVKSAAPKSMIFDGSAKAREALSAVGDPEAAKRYGDVSLAQLVLKLNGNKLPPAGALVAVGNCHFQILTVDASAHRISSIRVVGK